MTCSFPECPNPPTRVVVIDTDPAASLSMNTERTEGWRKLLLCSVHVENWPDSTTHWVGITP